MNGVSIFNQQDFEDLTFFNNILLSDGGQTRILNGTIRSGIWENNVYGNTNGSATGGFTYGKNTDPNPTSPGAGGINAPALPLNTGFLIQRFTPTGTSPAINARLTLGLPMAQGILKGFYYPSEMDMILVPSSISKNYSIIRTALFSSW